jgi:mycofactocin precursor
MTVQVEEQSETTNADPARPGEDPVLAELLVEEISIDGMCGVY